MIPLHSIKNPFRVFRNGFFVPFGVFGERVAHKRAFAVAGGDDGVARRIFAGIDHREAAVLRDIAFGAFGFDLFEFLVRVRLAAAGVDGLNQNLVFVHMLLLSARRRFFF